MEEQTVDLAGEVEVCTFLRGGQLEFSLVDQPRPFSVAGQPPLLQGYHVSVQGYAQARDFVDVTHVVAYTCAPAEGGKELFTWRKA